MNYFYKYLQLLSDIFLIDWSVGLVLNAHQMFFFFTGKDLFKSSVNPQGVMSP